jgi:hypothetical protein
MARKRIYETGDTVPFSVRVHEKHSGITKRIAARLGVSETQAKRLIVEAGAAALEAVA